MSEASNGPLSRLQIAPEKKIRHRGGPKIMLGGVIIFLLAATITFIAMRKREQQPVPEKKGTAGALAAAGAATAANTTVGSDPTSPVKPGKPC